MKIREIYERIDALYPKRLSDEYIAAYGGRDNSGILIDPGKEVTGAVFSLDFSMGALAFAKERGANLLVTHHPAIFFPIASLRTDDPLGARLLAAAREEMGVISMHLNCDCAAGGIDESLARAAGADGEVRICEPLENAGYGRIYDVREQTLSEFAERLKKELGARRAFVYGEAESPVRRAASFCGAGADEGAVRHAREAGADVIVSSDIKHNIICDAREAGLKLIQLTHYASENYGFKKIYQHLSGKLGVPCAYWEDAGLL